MPSLIKKIQEKYDFQEIEPTVIPGYSSTIFLNNYTCDFEGKACDFTIHLSEVHDGTKKIKNELILSVSETFALYDPIGLIHITDENKFFQLIEILNY